MTWLFVRLYLGVLTVLFLAWYIHGSVLQRRTEADRARVFEEAHGGGARLVARELDSAPANRPEVLEALRDQFGYPVEIVATDSLPRSLQRRFAKGNHVAYYHPAREPEFVLAALRNGTDVARLGPFPNYDGAEIENAIKGWMRLTAGKLEVVPTEAREAVLGELQKQFYFPIEVAPREDLPLAPRQRIADGRDVVFYQHEEDRYFAATPLGETSDIVRFGPFPSFEKIEQKAATTTVALVLLPAALAIALLLRPVARQLRQVENTAQSIAAGDLSARVNERVMNSAKPLAQAFNNMASQTETLVRTQRELLQAVSHELRTPLSRMRFAINLIETAKDDKEREQRLASLDAATEELDELVGELLSYVRMETAEPRLAREHIALHDSLAVLIPKHAGLHPSVQFDVSEGIASDKPIVCADRTGFQRVLGNLIGNAGRYAKSRVLVAAAANGKGLTVDVDDDGSGIAESDRERVFEPFVRLDNGANGHGAGLGLALVKRIVIQHGGSIEVMTSPLGGCRMRTTWPNEVQQADQ